MCLLCKLVGFWPIECMGRQHLLPYIELEAFDAGITDKCIQSTSPVGSCSFRRFFTKWGGGKLYQPFRCFHTRNDVQGLIRTLMARFFGEKRNSRCTTFTLLTSSTVDGRNPKQPPGMYKKPVNNGITHQPQLVSRISEPSTVLYPEKNHIHHTTSTTMFMASQKHQKKLPRPWFPQIPDAPNDSGSPGFFKHHGARGRW